MTFIPNFRSRVDDLQVVDAFEVFGVARHQCPLKGQRNGCDLGICCINGSAMRKLALTWQHRARRAWDYRLRPCAPCDSSGDRS
jgi:hypothetical protein